MSEHGHIPGSEPRDKSEPIGPRYECAAASEQGEDVKPNQDRMIARPDLGLVAAIDGAGGHNDGDKAAEITASIVEATIETYINHDGTTPEVLVKHALSLADQEVKQYNLKVDSNSMAAAAVALRYEKDGAEYAAVASIGDARVYILSADGTLRCVTVDNVDDDTPAEDIAQKKIGQDYNDEITSDKSEEERKFLGNRRFVSHMAGSDGHNPRVTTVALMPGDIIITTSDGIHDVLTKSQMQQIGSDYRGTPQAIVHGIVGAAREQAVNPANVRRKTDDRTVVALAPAVRGGAGKLTRRNDIITEVPVFTTETQAPTPEKYPGIHETKLEKNGTVEIPVARLEGSIKIVLLDGISVPEQSFEVQPVSDEDGERLIILQSGHEPMEYAMGKGYAEIPTGSSIVLGRSEAGIYNDKFSNITDDRVSLRHVGIVLEDGRVVISDINTTNPHIKVTYTLN
jgi:serine/threonine protein phosphatase PrpC